MDKMPGSSDFVMEPEMFNLLPSNNSFFPDFVFGDVSGQINDEEFSNATFATNEYCVDFSVLATLNDTRLSIVSNYY